MMCGNIERGGRAGLNCFMREMPSFRRDVASACRGMGE